MDFAFLYNGSLGSLLVPPLVPSWFPLCFGRGNQKRSGKLRLVPWFPRFPRTIQPYGELGDFWGDLKFEGRRGGKRRDWLVYRLHVIIVHYKGTREPTISIWSTDNVFSVPYLFFEKGNQREPGEPSFTDSDSIFDLINKSKKDRVKEKM
jgi:hypothetical protein